MSLPLGALKLSLAYGRNDGSFITEKYDKMKQYILKSLPDKGGLDMSPDTALVGVGGTLRAISRHYNEQHFGYYVLGKKGHNCRIDYESIDIIHRKLCKMKPKEIAKITAIGINRANTITAGSCVVNMLMLKLEFGEIVVSISGLRDGILSSFLELPTYTSIDNNNINIDSDQIQNLLELFVDRRKGL
jgi:exopolyphosphatase/guanosine-5'-triphosphate,3'-diphosphate pyrophosphatase